MKILKREIKQCLSCMEKHEVHIVEMLETSIFKNEKIEFLAQYEFCSNANETFENETMMRINNLSLKDAYRQKMRLLTSQEIISIREKYDISQKDFSEILEWGQKTITRYENHQVQDRAHDDILRKIDNDPQWFLDLLERSHNNLSEKAFLKYKKSANHELKRSKNIYLMNVIKSQYVDYADEMITGYTKLNLNKVIEMVNYFTLKIDQVHKVKLMKLLWYADFLNFKLYSVGISGLVYQIETFGALPICHEEIIDLDGIKYEYVQYNYEQIGYRFITYDNFKINELSKNEVKVIDSVINQLGHLSGKEIAERMHQENAYLHSTKNQLISYKYAKDLSIN